MDLLAFEMQRFLPGERRPACVRRRDRRRDRRVPRLAASQQPELHLEIGLSMADYLIRSEQPEMRSMLIGSLPEPGAESPAAVPPGDPARQRLHALPARCGTACDHFGQALGEAAAMTAADQLQARREGAQGTRVLPPERGLVAGGRRFLPAGAGRHLEVLVGAEHGRGPRGDGLDPDQLGLRQGPGRRLPRRPEPRGKRHHRPPPAWAGTSAEGNSWSVCGEVYRYERRFQKAWEAYADAERIFEEQRNWPWLGLIYQEQAICLFQAAEDGVVLDAGPGAGRGGQAAHHGMRWTSAATRPCAAIRRR